MAVREVLLTLLSVEPNYGFRLHTELVRRLPHRAGLNVGQSYTTLERAKKSGLVENAGFTEDGLPLFRLSASGKEAVRAWLNGADGAGSALDETSDRVLTALSLGRLLPNDFDAVEAIVAAEHQRWIARANVDDSVMDTVEDAYRHSQTLLAGAAVDWLGELRAGELNRFEQLFSTDRPRRGRPKRAQATTKAGADAHASQPAHS